MENGNSSKKVKNATQLWIWKLKGKQIWEGLYFRPSLLQLNFLIIGFETWTSLTFIWLKFHVSNHIWNPLIKGFNRGNFCRDGGNYGLLQNAMSFNTHHKLMFALRVFTLNSTLNIQLQPNCWHTRFRWPKVHPN